MSSGVKLHPECVEAFNNFKLGKKEAFLIYGFNDNLTQIVLLHKENIKPVTDETPKAKNAQWETLISMLPNNDVRYAVADVHYSSPEGQLKTDMVFLTWAPETASIKKRMLMASSKETLKNALVGCRQTIQACCYPDLELKSIAAEKFKGTVE